MRIPLQPGCSRLPVSRHLHVTFPLFFSFLFFKIAVVSKSAIKMLRAAGGRPEQTCSTRLFHPWMLWLTFRKITATFSPRCGGAGVNEGMRELARSHTMWQRYKKDTQAYYYLDCSCRLSQFQQANKRIILCKSDDTLQTRFWVTLKRHFVVRYLRHKTELPSWLDTLPFLDIVGRDGALSAHRVPRSVPVGILSRTHEWQRSISAGDRNGGDEH